jgi:phenylpropionate dioxygenase-like ring-hydroxylating dioxygenase large terminal subunit
MFTAEDNEILTRVGPGTPMGELFRRFWIPFMLAEELPGPDCEPKRVRLLGEDLIAFRDSNGRLGLLDRYCAHRRVDLYFGRNEECGLRCPYHGWKYDVEGKILDIPSEPPDSPLKDEIRLKSYPIEERGGVIWAYMGPPAFPAAPPDFEWTRVPAANRHLTKRLQETNYAQGVEGGIDSSHVSILHSRLDPAKAGRPFAERQVALVPNIPYLASDTRPKFFVSHSDYGFLIAARRRADEDSYYWRFTQFLLPFYTIVPRSSAANPMFAHSWTPIDDEHCWVFTMTWSPDAALTEETRDQRGVHAEVIDDGSYRPVQNKSNNYLLDREVQRLQSNSGIKGIGVQDSAVQESMGPIVDRSRENLGTSDTAIVAFRRLLLKLAKGLAAGEEPQAATHPQWYRVRSGGAVIPKNVDYREASREQLTAQI